MRRTNRSSVLCLRHHHHHRPRHHYRHQRLRRCRRHHRQFLVLSHHHYHLLFKKKKSSFPCSSSSLPLLQGRESRIIRGTNCFEKFKRSIYLWFLTTKRCLVLRITQNSRSSATVTQTHDSTQRPTETAIPYIIILCKISIAPFAGHSTKTPHGTCASISVAASSKGLCFDR